MNASAVEEATDTQDNMSILGQSGPSCDGGNTVGLPGEGQWELSKKAGGKYAGVCWVKSRSRWVATHNNKYVGSFDTAEKAASARWLHINGKSSDAAVQSDTRSTETQAFAEDDAVVSDEPKPTHSKDVLLRLESFSHNADSPTPAAAATTPTRITASAASGSSPLSASKQPAPRNEATAPAVEAVAAPSGSGGKQESKPGCTITEGTTTGSVGSAPPRGKIAPMFAPASVVAAPVVAPIPCKAAEAQRGEVTEQTRTTGAAKPPKTQPRAAPTNFSERLSSLDHLGFAGPKFVIPAECAATFEECMLGGGAAA